MKINLTDEQACVLIDALDLYTRVHLGQFEEVANIALGYSICRDGASEPEDFHNLREAIGGVETNVLWIRPKLKPRYSQQKGSRTRKDML